MLRFDIRLKSPLRGHPFLFLSSPFPPAPPQFLVWLGSFIAMGMGRTVASTCFTSAAGSGQDQLLRGNTVGTGACGEHGLGLGVCMMFGMNDPLPCGNCGISSQSRWNGCECGLLFCSLSFIPFCLPGALAYNNINSVRIHPGLELFYRPWLSSLWRQPLSHSYDYHLENPWLPSR